MKRKLFVKVVFRLFLTGQVQNDNENLIFMEIARKLSEIIKQKQTIFMEISGLFVVIYVQKTPR